MIKCTILSIEAVPACSAALDLATVRAFDRQVFSGALPTPDSAAGVEICGGVPVRACLYAVCVRRGHAGVAARRTAVVRRASRQPGPAWVKIAMFAGWWLFAGR